MTELNHDKRNAFRLPEVLDVHLALAGDEAVFCRTRDVSPRGLCLWSERELTTTGNCRLMVRAGKRFVPVAGPVRWIRRQGNAVWSGLEVDPGYEGFTDFVRERTIMRYPALNHLLPICRNPTPEKSPGEDEPGVIRHGLSFVWPAAETVGTRLSLVVRLPAPRQPLLLEGIVTWSEPDETGWRLGMDASYRLPSDWRGLDAVLFETPVVPAEQAIVRGNRLVVDDGQS